MLVLAAAGHAGRPAGGYTLPAQYSFFLDDPVLGSTTAPITFTSIIDTYAYVDITTVALYDDPSSTVFDGLDDAMFKIVEESMTLDEARAGACLTSAIGDRYVSGTWATTGVSTTVRTTATEHSLTADVGLWFEMGGLYQLCYSRNGTFGVNDADLMQVPIRAKGVFDTNCTAQDCLKEHRYECYLRKDSYGTADGLYAVTSSCAVDYSYVGAGFKGDPLAGTVAGERGMGTWSAEFSATVASSTGEVTAVTTQACGSTPASFICKNGGACDAGTQFIEPLEIAARADAGQIFFPATSNSLTGDTFYPRTVAACYCAGRDDGTVNAEPCTSEGSFVQQIGILHYYLSKVCHVLDTSCESDYTGIVPQYQFRVRIECPTDACSANDNSRMKLVQEDANNDLPSWSSNNGCGSAQHGMLGTTNVFPETTVDGGGTINPQNCDGPLDCSLTGGSRQDYKEFGGDGGFQFVLGDSHHEVRRFHESKLFDVCYCNDDCGVASSWFKVGQMRLSPTRLVSAATSKSTTAAQMSVEFLNAEGTVGLNRPYSDSGTLGLNEDAVLKILEDQDMVVTDTDCAENGYDPTLVDGLSSSVDASLNYRSSLQTESTVDLTKLVFNSNSFVNVVSIKKPGNIAICYCAITFDSVCVEETNWKLVTHMTIKGPRTLQSWTFSTNINFRFEYTGYGLTSSDTLRIISSDGSCTDNNGDPNSADFSYTAIRVKCPDPCSDVTLNDGDEPGDISTMVLSSDSYNCDEQNAECSTNDIANLTVLSETETELVFEYDHGLAVDEEITLGDNIDVDCADDDESCLDEKDEQIATLKGVFDYADIDTHTSDAPDTYMAAHRITYASGNILRIGVGWPAPVPNFVVVRVGANLAVGDIGRGGLWTHRSRAITREEIQGTAEKANLRVCWQYGGHGARYVEEVGRLTIVAPTTMLGATLSLTSTLYGQTARAILTFTTATGVTGLRYEEAEGSLRLNFVITDTDKFDMKYADGTDMELDYAEGDKDNSKQSSCGKLFLELWSDDSERGFPLPKGCYFESYASGTGTGYERKITMLFEGMSGLNKDSTYMVVFNAAVIADSGVVEGDAVMEIFTMDDVINKPYEAIEYGEVLLASTPQERSGGDDPMFREPDGFKIVGGPDELLQVSTADNMKFEIMGGGEYSGTTWVHKPITAGHIIRIYLWPLTQWETASVCQASCYDEDQSNFVCGEFPSCVGEPTVESMNNNVLKFTMPDTMIDILGSAKGKIELSGLTIPAGGFFATRLAAQVSGADDLVPHYVESVGDFIWKEPNEGHPVSKVMSSAGGGNEMPFRGDEGNVLYAKILLSSTLLAVDSTAGEDASFTLTLPPGYTCLNEQSSAEDGDNAWAAETTLAALEEVPQGRGTPSDGTTSIGWSVNGSTCTFTPEHPHGVVYAGSSLIVRIVTDNPADALERSNPTNLWSVEMTGKGRHPTLQQTTQKYNFVANEDEEFYQANVAVLGRISDTFCQATDLAPVLPGQPLYVRVFFRPESEVESGGLVRVVAPTGYLFSADCLAEDLEEMYYAADDGGEATLRLPGIASCTSTVDLQADIRLENILRSGQLYGFKLRVQDDTSVADAEDDWNIYTADADDYLIDGTETSMSCSFGTGQYWGPRMSSTLIAEMYVGDMRPYDMTQDCTNVDVNIAKVPSGDSGSIYFFAPEGYEWDMGCASKQYTYSFPAGVPTQSGAVLTWSSATFSDAETYMFSAPVRVPHRSPTASSHAFFLQFGEVAAAALDAPLVRALKNAAVDYTSTVLAKENVLQFQVETVTDIPAEGGIAIVAAAGFTFEASCDVGAVLDPTAPTPPDLECTSTLDPVLERYRLRLRVPAGASLPAGLHYFAVLGENPEDPVLNYPDLTSACGTSECWLFDTYENLDGDDADLGAATKLDHGTAAQGFSIRTQMYDAAVPDISDAERYATGREDRPLMPNSVVFSFEVIEAISGAMTLILRGPAGFVFEEDCLSTVEVSQSTVFGVGSKFPPEYTVWPDGVSVTDCTGSSADAHMTLAMTDSSAAFNVGSLYVFRIGFTNPEETPAENYWTIELAPVIAAGQSSSRFDGLSLWALTNTDVSAISTSRVQYGDETLENPVTISFRPHNSVESTGYIIAEAPADFTFVHLASMVCEASLEEVPYSVLGVEYPGYEWATENIICVVDATNTAMATISFTDTYPLTSGLDYALVLKVLNPQIMTGEATEWKLSTWEEDGTALDGGTITSFVVNDVIFTFEYSDIEQNGGAALPDDFNFKIQLPAGLTSGDRIVLAGPPGFVLDSSVCGGLIWYLIEDAAPFPGYSPLPLPGSFPTCTGDEIRLEVNGPEDQMPVANTVLQFHVPLTNPTSTPDEHYNFWTCTHLDAAGNINSMKAITSWEIFPQIADVTFKLLGPLLAAGSTSSVKLTFRPVSDAEDVLISVSEPSGFNFDGAVVEDSAQEVVVVYGNAIRIQMAIQADTVTTIQLDNVVLGQGGGQTVITLTTYTGGLFQNGVWIEGEQLDEISQFSEGFRLPGDLKVISETLENAFQQDSDNYPVESQWSVQMGQVAFARFDFYVTIPALAGTELVISGTPYVPTAGQFLVQLKQSTVSSFAGSVAAQVISTTSIAVVNGTLRAVLGGTLVANEIYQVEMSVVTPEPYEVQTAESSAVGAIYWTITTEDGDELPANTNDAESREFRIVEQLGFNVTSEFSPPTALVEVALTISVGLYYPTELTVVAPEGFTFPDDCLVYGGIEVLACAPGTAVSGRSTAVLTVAEAGITYMPPDVRIRVYTPTVTPANKEWFIEGTYVWNGMQACWGKATGIDVMQMTDTAVTYPAIGTVQSRIVWEFTTQKVVDSGGYLEIDLPDGFDPQCSGNMLELLSFPTFSTCLVQPDGNSVVILLNTTIVPDKYVFAFYVTPPVLTPEPNLFSITLKDSSGAVQDAAIGVPGIAMMDKLQVQEAPLYWTVSSPGWPTEVTMGFEVLETFPDLFVAADQQVGQILLSFPQGFVHQVSSETDLTILSGSMPLQSQNWLDYTQKDYLVIALNLNQTFWTTLSRATYQFRIPVMIPYQLPAYNVWHVSLCKLTTQPDACTHHTDPGVLVTFAIPGFPFGDGSSGNTGGAPRRSPPAKALVLWAIIAPVLLALCTGEHR